MREIIKGWYKRGCRLLDYSEKENLSEEKKQKAFEFGFEMFNRIMKIIVKKKKNENVKNK